MACCRMLNGCFITTWSLPLVFYLNLQQKTISDYTFMVTQSRPLSKPNIDVKLDMNKNLFPSKTICYPE